MKRALLAIFVVIAICAVSGWLVRDETRPPAPDLSAGEPPLPSRESALELWGVCETTSPGAHRAGTGTDADPAGDGQLALPPDEYPNVPSPWQEGQQ